MKNINLISWLRNWFYTKEENYNKTEVDGLLAKIIEDIGSTGTGGSNVDLSNYYTKNETDNLLTAKLNTNLGVANKNVVTDENGNVSLEEKSGNNGFGSFYVNDEGHLIAVIPSNVNPYRLGDDGHLYYNTGV